MSDNEYRVKRYEATTTHLSTGSANTGSYPFLESHFSEVGLEYSEEGMPLEAAKKLIEKWNRKGCRHSPIIYRYRIDYPLGLPKPKYFLVTCYSKCRTYFAPYLKTVTVLASDPENAKDLAEAWCKDTGKRFISPRAEWNVEELNVNPKHPQVIDWHADSDY